MEYFKEKNKNIEYIEIPKVVKEVTEHNNNFIINTLFLLFLILEKFLIILKSDY